MLKTITLQFKKPVDIGGRELCELLPRAFHDVTSATIDFEPRLDKIKTLVLNCDRCSPDGVLLFIRSLDKEKIEVLKGLIMTEQKEVKAPEEVTIDINKTCEDLGNAFKAIFGTTGGLSESLSNISGAISTLQKTVADQNEQIAALQLLVDGRPADAAAKTPAVLGLKDAVESIRQDANAKVEDAKTTLTATVDKKVAEVDTKVARIETLEKSCRAIEKHLAETPLFERVLKDDGTTPQPVKARPKGT